jgi:hypothetical protein
MTIRTTNALVAAQDIAAAYRSVEGELLPLEVSGAAPDGMLGLDNGRVLWITQEMTDDRKDVLLGVYRLTEMCGETVLRVWNLTRRGRLMRRHRS